MGFSYYIALICQTYSTRGLRYQAKSFFLIFQKYLQKQYHLGIKQYLIVWKYNVFPVLDFYQMLDHFKSKIMEVYLEEAIRSGIKVMCFQGLWKTLHLGNNSNHWRQALKIVVSSKERFFFIAIIAIIIIFGLCFKSKLPYIFQYH